MISRTQTIATLLLLLFTSQVFSGCFYTKPLKTQKLKGAKGKKLFSTIWSLRLPGVDKRHSIKPKRLAYPFLYGTKRKLVFEPAVMVVDDGPIKLDLGEFEVIHVKLLDGVKTGFLVGGLTVVVVGIGVGAFLLVSLQSNRPSFGF